MIVLCPGFPTLSLNPPYIYIYIYIYDYNYTYHYICICTSIYIYTTLTGRGSRLSLWVSGFGIEGLGLRAEDLGCKVCHFGLSMSDSGPGI